MVDVAIFTGIFTSFTFLFIFLFIIYLFFIKSFFLKGKGSENSNVNHKIPCLF